MKNLPRAFWFGLACGAAVLVLIAAVPAITDFNTNQFDTTGNKIAVKNGAIVSNLLDTATAQVNGLQVTNLSLPTLSDVLALFGHKAGDSKVYSGGGALLLTGTNAAFQGWISLSGVTNRLSMVGGVLLFDGSPVASVTQNTIMVSNIVVTNITVVTINNETNLFTVGKGGKLTVNTTFTLIPAGPSAILRTDSNTNVVAATIGAGLAFDGTTLSSTVSSGTTVSVNATNVTTPNFQDTATVTWAKSGSNLTATAVASSTPTSFNALTQTGTNASAMNFSGLANGSAFYLTVSNTLFMPTPSNIPATPFTFYVYIQQPSTGTCFVTWTNVTFSWSEGAAPVSTTNGSAVDLFTFVNDPLTNTILHGVLTPNVHK